MSGDFRVTITIRNGKLWRAINAAGYDSARKFAIAHGITYTQLMLLLQLKLTPYKSTGELREVTELICAALATDVYDLFPASMMDRRLERNSVTVDMDEAGIAGLLESPKTPEELLSIAEGNAQLLQLISTLPPRRARALTLYYGLDGEPVHTLEEVGQALGGIGRERVRQIVANAERLLQTPKNKQALKDAARAVGVL